MTIDIETRRQAIIRIGFRESFEADSLTARYEKPFRRPQEGQEPRNLPAGLDLMGPGLADQLRAAWEEHGARLYVVRSHGIPIAWTAVGQDDHRMTVPRYRYPRQLTERHQALARRA